MNVIEFAKDYKKLHCRTGDIFTTIRRDSDINAEKFWGQEGNVFQVKMGGRDAFKAKLLFNLGWNPHWLKSFPKGLLEYDTDGNMNELVERYGNDRILLLIFQKMGDDSK